MTVDLVHLIWAPPGPDPFRRFLESYRTLPAGAEHTLVLAFNDFRDAEHARPWDALAREVRHRRLEMSGSPQDLAAYRQAAAASEARRLCFTNSYSIVLAEGWLGALDHALDEPGIGMVGATGSWESTYSAAPLWLKPLRWRGFGPFPNPHLRTNAFMLDRELLLDLDWPSDVDDKLAALRLENGRRSVSSQVLERDLSIAVVGRDRRAYPPEDWPTSRTFRSGEQENLLVADNRTAQYVDAEPARRRQLARLAWGDAAAERPSR